MSTGANAPVAPVESAPMTGAQDLKSMESVTKHKCTNNVIPCIFGGSAFSSRAFSVALKYLQCDGSAKLVDDKFFLEYVRLII